MTTRTQARWIGAAVVALTLSLLPWNGLIAQATLQTTTLAAAMSATANSMTVASATGIAAGYLGVIDGEAFEIGSQYATGTTVPVSRGARGTGSSAHASGAVVFVGPTNRFYTTDPVGPCTRTAETALPHVTIGTGGSNPPTVSVYDCSGATAATSRWQLFLRGGYPVTSLSATGSASGSTVTYTSAGAITPQPGSVFVNGAALAMTIVNPTLWQNGMSMCVIATNASAHTLTYTAGFNGGTTARDVGTFGGAVGDNICFFGNNGVWWVISSRNVTLA